MGLAGAAAGLLLLGAAAGEDSAVLRCYASDQKGAVFYTSDAYRGSAAHADGDYFAFTAALTHRFHVAADEESGTCLVADGRAAADARVDAAWKPFREAGKRRVDTGWKPERVR